MGDGSTTESGVPRLLLEQNGGALTGIVAISAGSNHSVALKADGHLLGWGANGSGQLGDDASSGRYRAVPALDSQHRPLTGVVRVSAQGDYTLARLRDGHVLAWGYNGSGQLGDGTTRARGYPLPVVDLGYLPIGAIAEVAGGWRHGLALLGSGPRAGHLLAWGEDAQGQLGDNNWVDRSRAGAVLTAAGGELSGVHALAAGGYHSLALLDNGTLLAWGDNSQGQLGSGVGADRRLPTPVTDAAGQALPNLSLGVTDQDFDGIADTLDNCPSIANTGQGDLDRDGLGDACDPDQDDDGLSDTDEAARGTNPRTRDTDADGMPDGWEVAHGLDPLRDDAQGDADRDGARNLLEYQSATDPADKRDLPTLLLPNRSGWRAILR